MMRISAVTVLVVAGTLLAACGDKPQTASNSHKRSDTLPYEGAAKDPFVAKGWTPGDRTSWENQIRQRNQYQNEYTRTP